jgi:hypothetical protein
MSKAVHDAIGSRYLPRTRALQISEIEADDVVAMVGAIKARGARDIARRALELLAQIFRYAIAHGHAKRSPAEFRPRDVLKASPTETTHELMSFQGSPPNPDLAPETSLLASFCDLAATEGWRRARGRTTGRADDEVDRHPDALQATISRLDHRHNYALGIPPNLLGLNPTVPRANTIGAGHMAYIPTGERWLYLAVLLDLFRGCSEKTFPDQKRHRWHRFPFGRTWRRNFSGLCDSAEALW